MDATCSSLSTALTRAAPAAEQPYLAPPIRSNPPDPARAVSGSTNPADQASPTRDNTRPNLQSPDRDLTDLREPLNSLAQEIRGLASGVGELKSTKNGLNEMRTSIDKLSARLQSLDGRLAAEESKPWDNPAIWLGVGVLLGVAVTVIRGIAWRNRGHAKPSPSTAMQRKALRRVQYATSATMRHNLGLSLERDLEQVGGDGLWHDEWLRYVHVAVKQRLKQMPKSEELRSLCSWRIFGCRFVPNSTTAPTNGHGPVRRRRRYARTAGKSGWKRDLPFASQRGWFATQRSNVLEIMLPKS